MDGWEHYKMRKAEREYRTSRQRIADEKYLEEQRRTVEPDQHIRIVADSPIARVTQALNGLSPKTIGPLLWTSPCPSCRTGVLRIMLRPPSEWLGRCTNPDCNGEDLRKFLFGETK